MEHCNHVCCALCAASLALGTIGLFFRRREPIKNPIETTARCSKCDCAVRIFQDPGAPGQWRVACPVCLRSWPLAE